MIDLHCHIDLYENPRAVVEACSARAMFVLSVTNTPLAWDETSKLTKTMERMPTALGLHPQLAGQRESELALFDELIDRTGWLGEIGLDGSPEHLATWTAQERVFAHILRRSTQAGGRVMSIHSRRAVGPVLAALQRFPDSGTPVLHWFSGTMAELEDAVELGCWFSIGQPMLRSKKGTALVMRMPRERVLTETDGPFVQANGQPARPWDVADVEKGLATEWGMDDGGLRTLLDTSLARLVPVRSGSRNSS